MKILALNYEYPPIGGGGGMGLKQYAEGWVSLDHDVTVISSSPDLSYRHETVNGVDVHRVPVFPQQDPNVTSFLTMLTYIISAILVGWYLINRDNYDVMNTHFAIPSGPVGLVLSRLSGTRNVQTIIGGDVYDPSKTLSPHRHWWLRWVVRTVCSGADSLVSISTDTADRARRYYDIEGATIVPYGFDPPERSSNPGPEKLDFDPDRYHLVSIGRLVPRKGYGYLLEALADLDDPEVVFHLIGDGPLRDELGTLTGELNLEDTVSFEGAVRGERKFHFLEASDVYVLPSLHEGLGIVIQEAMYSGLPIVATNNGGQTDLLEEDENALLVPPANASALANAIDRLKRDEGLAENMRENNREKITNYSVEAMSRRYIEIFGDVA